MKNLIIYLLMLLHVNYVMFIPCMDEVDCIDRRGVQQDDINSLCEFVNQIVLGHKDSTPEDEDDDQAHYSIMAKAQLHTQVVSVLIYKTTSTFISGHIREKFLERPNPEIHSVAAEIIVPPPEA